MKKKVKIILSKEAKEVYDYLKYNSNISKIEHSIFNSFNLKIELLKHNVHFGNPINKKLIPKEYINKYNLKNLFRVELPNF